MGKRLHLQRKHLRLLGIIILILILPITLILVKTVQDQRSSAALPNNLETEGGVLSSSGVSRQNDSGASGKSYVLFNKPSGPSPTNPTPGNLQYPLLRALEYRPLRSLQMPSLNSPSIDPEFGTEIIRVSRNEGQRNRYPTKAAWSANGKYLILDRGSPRVLLDGDTYEVLQSGLYTGGQFTWSPVDDSVAWTTSGNRIIRFSISDSRWDYGTDFTTNYDSLSLGGAEGSPSIDGKFLPLKVSRGSSYGMAVYDTEEKKIISEYLYSSSAVNNLGMSPSGDFIIVQGTGTGSDIYNGTWVYDRDLNPNSRRLLSSSIPHHDNCRDPSDAFDQTVMPFSDPVPGVYAFRLDRDERVQVSDRTNRIHVSCRSHLRPGYAYIAHYSVPGEGGNYTWNGYGEIFAVKTDGSELGKAESYAQTHSVLPLGYSNYVFATPSPYGERVIWGTEWSEYGGLTKSSYSFVAGVNVKGP